MSGVQKHYIMTAKGKEMSAGYWFADRLVFNKVKQVLGLDRCILQASAAAPITQETVAFFQSLDIPVYEIYGMSECSGPQTLSFDGQHKTGSAGKSIPGSEIKIVNGDREGNGEICYRGRHIFMGYMHDEEQTSTTIDKDGWLHSGDIGKLDKNNFLTITGRIKEIIITAGGENIAPIPIEDKCNVQRIRGVSFPRLTSSSIPYLHFPNQFEIPLI
eukprot:sb/3469967/